MGNQDDKTLLKSSIKLDGKIKIMKMTIYRDIFKNNPDHYVW